jgi:hypothetical protein
MRLDPMYYEQRMRLETIDRTKRGWRREWRKKHQVTDGEKLVFPRADTDFVDHGVEGVRSVAVDFSGKCGAPMLIAIADTVRGGEKVKTWKLPIKSAGIRGNTWRVQPGAGPYMRGWLLTPSDAKLRPGIEVSDRSGPTGSRFFAVMVVQRGPAAKATVQGEGLASMITIGERTVRFDGEKIILGNVGGPDNSTTMPAEPTSRPAEGDDADEPEKEKNERWRRWLNP